MWCHFPLPSAHIDLDYHMNYWSMERGWLDDSSWHSGDGPDGMASSKRGGLAVVDGEMP